MTCIAFPQSRTAPPALLQQLREIDANAELVYFGAGRWALGVYRPHRQVIAAAARRLAFLSHFARATRDDVHGTRLETTGFRPIHWYTIQGEPDGRIVEDFRLRDFNYRNQADATFAARMSESAGEVARAEHDRRLRSNLQAAAPDAWRHAFKNPVSVS